MPEKSEKKVTSSVAIDKPKQPAAPTEPVKGQLSEQELEKVAGGVGLGLRKSGGSGGASGDGYLP